jgi:hypothetical protein
MPGGSYNSSALRSRQTTARAIALAGGREAVLPHPTHVPFTQEELSDRVLAATTVLCRGPDPGGSRSPVGAVADRELVQIVYGALAQR